MSIGRQGVPGKLEFSGLYVPMLDAYEVFWADYLLSEFLGYGYGAMLPTCAADAYV